MGGQERNKEKDGTYHNKEIKAKCQSYGVFSKKIHKEDNGPDGGWPQIH